MTIIKKLNGKGYVNLMTGIFCAIMGIIMFYKHTTVGTIFGIIDIIFATGNVYMYYIIKQVTKNDNCV